MHLGSDSHLSIIKALYYNNMSTCLDISKTIEASIPHVAKNINELIDAGYIVETGLATSNGGRKPVMYSLVADKKYILSVAIDQFFTRLCLVDLHNKFVTGIHQVPLDLTTHPSAAQELVNQINIFLDQTHIDRKKVYGAGIAMPGFVDVDRGINHTFFRVEADSLQDFIAEGIGMHVFIDNDSSAIALAELKFGAGRSSKELMVINIGWGIGLGMVVNGKLFRGSTGFAGEFSHIPLFKNGKKCSCGKYGCLETEASLITIEAKAAEHLKTGKNNKSHANISPILKSASQGDPFAVKLISEAAYNIGQGIAVLIHIMNPELIVLSGKGIEAGKIWLPPIQQAINEFCIPTLTQDTEVILSSLGSNAQQIGAAALTMEKITSSFFV